MKPDGRPADPLLSSPRGLRRRNLPQCSGRFRLVWRIGKGKLEPSQVITNARRAVYA